MTICKKGRTVKSVGSLGENLLVIPWTNQRPQNLLNGTESRAESWGQGLPGRGHATLREYIRLLFALTWHAGRIGATVRIPAQNGLSVF
jgi:hypothetical protein